jgi:hypothetical protein
MLGSGFIVTQALAVGLAACCGHDTPTLMSSRAHEAYADGTPPVGRLSKRVPAPGSAPC